MIMPTHQGRILVATQPVDVRKGHDGLAALVQSVLEHVAFIRIHTTCSCSLISHVREAQNRFRF